MAFSTAPASGTPKWASNSSGVLIASTATVSLRPKPTPHESRGEAAHARKRLSPGSADLAMHDGRAVRPDADGTFAGNERRQRNQIGVVPVEPRFVNAPGHLRTALQTGVPAALMHRSGWACS